MKLYHHQKETFLRRVVDLLFIFQKKKGGGKKTQMAADDSVASLYALYKPIWAAEEADRCTRWAAFLAELSGSGDEDGNGMTEEEASTSTTTTPSPNPSALPLSASRQAAGLAALDALIRSWRKEDDGSPCDDEPRREKLARLRALAQAGLPMVRRGREIDGGEAIFFLFVLTSSSLYSNSPTLSFQSIRGPLWVSFLGVRGKKVPGEYERLCGDAAADTETRKAKAAAAASSSSAAAAVETDDAPSSSPSEEQRRRAAKRAAWDAATASWDAQIGRDVPRTLAGHPLFDSSEEGGRGRRRRRRRSTATATKTTTETTAPLPPPRQQPPPPRPRPPQPLAERPSPASSAPTPAAAPPRGTARG